MHKVSDDIHILCGGGLGNKLPSLSGGIAVAKFYEKNNIIIHWLQNHQCAASFRDLFSSDCASKFNLAPVTVRGTDELYYDDYKDILSTLPNSVLYGFEPNTHPIFINVRENHPRSLISYRNKTIVYESNLPNFFIDPITQLDLFKKHFQFREDLVAEAEKFINANNISKKTLGVHMRIGGPGNWEDPKCKTSIEENIEQILSLQNKYENVFISTDDSNILPTMNKTIKKCSYRLSESPTPIGTTSQYLTSTQVQGAVVDLLVLAQTDLQVYNIYSTYALWGKLLSDPIGDYTKFFHNGFMRPLWGY